MTAYANTSWQSCCLCDSPLTAIRTGFSCHRRRALASALQLTNHVGDLGLVEDPFAHGNNDRLRFPDSNGGPLTTWAYNFFFSVFRFACTDTPNDPWRLTTVDTS